ncbi:unnamed protein product [Protopolystoma xenopodis]|uniref:Uncharacterized protein n=1 Tax=Protopolystoma xenopodis TaxID=117903 RepID=A0A3S5A5P0_9PLAT|nr:unnamed protein product [Protopolystoma xenopodis]
MTVANVFPVTSPNTVVPSDGNVANSILSRAENFADSSSSTIPTSQDGAEYLMTSLKPASALRAEEFVETAYTRFMGHLYVVPFIARGFNIYFPCLVLILCMITYFRLGNRLLHWLGVPQLIDPTFSQEKPGHPWSQSSQGERQNFGQSQMESMDETLEAVEYGRLLLKRGKF